MGDVFFASFIFNEYSPQRLRYRKILCWNLFFFLDVDIEIHLICPSFVINTEIRGRPMSLIFVEESDFFASRASNNIIVSSFFFRLLSLKFTILLLIR